MIGFLMRLLQIKIYLEEFFKIRRAERSCLGYGTTKFLLVSLVVLSEQSGQDIAVAALGLSIKPSNGIHLTSIEGTQALEKLSPFHNIFPDAYLDPVSILNERNKLKLTATIDFNCNPFV